MCRWALHLWGCGLAAPSCRSGLSVGLASPSCQSTRWRWISHTFVSNDTLALGFRAVLACLFAMGWPSFFVGLPTSRAGFCRRGVACFDVGLPTSLCGLPYLVVVGLCTSAVGCPRCRSPPFVVVVSRASTLLGCPTLAFTSLRRRGVAYFSVGFPCCGVHPSSSLCGSNFGVGLPPLLWDALPPCSAPLVVVWCGTSALSWD